MQAEPSQINKREIHQFPKRDLCAAEKLVHSRSPASMVLRHWRQCHGTFVTQTADQPAHLHKGGSTGFLRVIIGIPGTVPIAPMSRAIAHNMNSNLTSTSPEDLYKGRPANNHWIFSFFALQGEQAVLGLLVPLHAVPGGRRGRGHCRSSNGCWERCCWHRGWHRWNWKSFGRRRTLR